MLTNLEKRITAIEEKEKPKLPAKVFMGNEPGAKEAAKEWEDSGGIAWIVYVV